MLDIETSGLTDIGKKRRANEDALLIEDDIRLYVVADGMGGHKAGEVASRIVVETMNRFMRDIHHGKTPPDEYALDKTLSPEANQLLAGIYQANLDVHQTAKADDAFHGMGSTISAVYFTDHTLIAANVGDSPIYLIHGDRIELLSVPHTVFAEQSSWAHQSLPLISRDYKHMLTRAMGIDKKVEVDLSEIQFYKNDMLVIGSDGLSDKVAPGEIHSLSQGVPVEQVCRSLVDLANERGGDDNITVIAIKVNAVANEGQGVLSRLKRKWNHFTRNV